MMTTTSVNLKAIFVIFASSKSSHRCNQVKQVKLSATEPQASQVKAPDLLDLLVDNTEQHDINDQGDSFWGNIVCIKTCGFTNWVIVNVCTEEAPVHMVIPGSSLDNSMVRAFLKEKAGQALDGTHHVNEPGVRRGNIEIKDVVMAPQKIPSKPERSGYEPTTYFKVRTKEEGQVCWLSRSDMLKKHLIGKNDWRLARDQAINRRKRMLGRVIQARLDGTHPTTGRLLEPAEKDTQPWLFNKDVYSWQGGDYHAIYRALDTVPQRAIKAKVV
jgi:hypothetical protein